MKLTSDLPHQLSTKLLADLPGEDAHFKMLPFKRQSAKDVFESGIDYRESAVSVLLYPKEEQWHLLLMKRPEYEGVHSGQVSFPGGKREEFDVDLQATALRELQEESGMDVRMVEVIGKLTTVYIPPSRFMVEPYVGVVHDRPEFTPDEREVEALIEMPLEDLLNDDLVKSTKMKFQQMNMSIDVPYFDVFGHVVWGATCAMLSELKEILIDL